MMAFTPMPASLGIAAASALTASSLWMNNWMPSQARWALVWAGISGAELLARVRSVAVGLYNLGIRKGDRVGILAESGPLWTIADYAILSNGAISVVTLPPLAVEQLQWTPHVTHMCAQTVQFYIGGIVISNQRLQSLPAASRDALIKRGAEMSDRLTKSIRGLDASAFTRMKASKKVYDLSDDSRKAWADVYRKVNQQLRGTLVSPAVYDRVMQLVGH